MRSTMTSPRPLPVVFDFHGSNPVLKRVLGVPSGFLLSGEFSGFDRIFGGHFLAVGVTVALSLSWIVVWGLLIGCQLSGV